MKKQLLVVEDDSDLNKLLTMNISDANHQVDSCDNGLRGLQMAMNQDYDAIVLDIMLPDMDGLEICRQLRANGKTTPILMLTARDSETDRIVGLEMGADDYLTKPFSIRELQARIKALLRRVDMIQQAQLPTQSSLLAFGELQLDEKRRQVSLKGQQLELTSTEFDLLIYMAKQPGLVFSRAELLDAVWGYNHSGYEHTVNSHINRLRNKIETHASDPVYIKTVWGVGYKFSEGEPR